MKKKNKYIQFIKNYWYFILLVIPIIICCYNSKTPDNDIWFLLNNGKSILNNGFTNIDTFTIHEGLHYTMQQWLSCVIFYIMFSKFGKYGLLFTVLFFLLLITIVLYKICYCVSKDKVKSVLITTVALSLAYDFYVTRPQIITFLILLLETLYLEKYIQNKNWKSLIPLPFLSILLVNCHCSMWYMQFVFVLPFLVDILFIKKGKKEILKNLLIFVLLMILAGLINPYGIKSIIYVFRAYGIKELNTNIKEMFYPVMNYNPWLFSNLLLYIYIFLAIHLCNKKRDYRFTLFVIGTFFLSSLHKKCIIYFLLWTAYAYSSFDIKIIIKGKIKRIFNSKYFVLIRTMIYSLIFISMVILLFIIGCKSFKNYNMNYKNEEIVKYIINNYDKEKVRLYASFEEGGYTEFMGLKSYIDPRAELFVKKYNGVYDYFKEYKTITSYPSQDYIKEFLNKYNFTHIIVLDGSVFERYLFEKSDYVLEYVLNDRDSKNVLYEVLYVRKDISIKK